MKNQIVKNIIRKAVVVSFAGLIIVSVVACGQKPIEGVSTEPTSSIQWETQEAQEDTHEAEADDLLNGGTESQAEQEETQEPVTYSWADEVMPEEEWHAVRLVEGGAAYEEFSDTDQAKWVADSHFAVGEDYLLVGQRVCYGSDGTSAYYFILQDGAGNQGYADGGSFEFVEEEEVAQGTEDASEQSEEVAQGTEEVPVSSEEVTPSQEVAQGGEEAVGSEGEDTQPEAQQPAGEPVPDGVDPDLWAKLQELEAAGFNVGGDGEGTQTNFDLSDVPDAGDLNNVGWE